MKTWLTKLRISNALDDRAPLSPSLARAVARSEELRRFAQTAADLEAALRPSRPAAEPPVALHAAIMRAVRSAEPARAIDGPGIRERWIPATALGLLVALGLIGAIHFHRPPVAVLPGGESPSLADAGSALELGGTLVREMPDATLSPLNDEMLRLKLDLAGAQAFLLASLP